MTRRYELGKRAELQEETRQRIIEAAISLHETLGMTRTGVTDIAKLAGVGRLTVYRHFPDEMAMGAACSGLYFQRNPFPDPSPWRSIDDPATRLRVGLSASYAYHRQTEEMLSRAIADVGDTPLMVPYHQYWQQAADVIAAAWRLRGRKKKLLRAGVGHAIIFPTWRSLAREQGLSDDQAVELMLRLTCDC